MRQDMRQESLLSYQSIHLQKLISKTPPTSQAALYMAI